MADGPTKCLTRRRLRTKNENSQPASQTTPPMQQQFNWSIVMQTDIVPWTWTEHTNMLLTAADDQGIIWAWPCIPPANEDAVRHSRRCRPKHRYSYESYRRPFQRATTHRSGLSAWVWPCPTQFPILTPTKASTSIRPNCTRPHGPFPTTKVG